MFLPIHGADKLHTSSIQAVVLLHKRKAFLCSPQLLYAPSLPVINLQTSFGTYFGPYWNSTSSSQDALYSLREESLF